MICECAVVSLACQDELRSELRALNVRAKDCRVVECVGARNVPCFEWPMSPLLQRRAVGRGERVRLFCLPLVQFRVHRNVLLFRTADSSTRNGCDEKNRGDTKTASNDST